MIDWIGIDLLALGTGLGAACALRPGARLACRLLAVLLLGAAAMAWATAQSAWLAGPALTVLAVLAAVGLVNAAAAGRGVRTR